jgi:hypothetical protein
MNPILKNVLVVVAGLFIGGMANSGIIQISASIIPPPNGADVTTMEGLKASMHLFEPKHFIMPFLAHALGTLISAIIISLFAANNKMKLALLAGVLSLIGGITAVCMLPSPLWFSIVDLGLAYIPMAFLGYKIGSLKK